MCRLGPYEGIQRRLITFEGNDIEDAVLPVLDEDDVTRLNRYWEVRDSEIISGHAVDANRSAEQAEMVTCGAYLV